MNTLPSHIGAYEVVRLLGKGGMAVVYLGRDPAIDRLVAIKLLRESLDSAELRERFSREARSAGRLRHPNIVTVFQVGVHDNAPFIVMEYIPGDSLADIIKRQPPVTLTWKLRVIEDLCRGLAYAHKAGVVHRDMKPANIQIDSDGEVKILDFGIARLGEQKAGEEALTRLGMMMGTPNYMAPEQINPGTADHRSDVFAVGLVLYELLTFRRAFGGDSYAVLHSILHQEPEPIDRSCPDIDPEILAIVARALAKNPDERYQDLGEMRDDIRRIRMRLRSAADDGSDEGPITQGAQTFAEADVTRLADRRTELSRLLDGARAAYAANDFPKAIECCEQALKFDPGFTEAIELGERAAGRITLARARDLIAAGQEAYAAGSLDTAASYIKDAEALQLPDDGGATVLAQLAALARAVNSAAERQKAVRERLERGRELLASGELDHAAQLVDEALGLSPGNRDAVALRTEVRAAIDAERARQRAAEDVVAEARLHAERAQFDAALALLQRHQPPHPRVAAALADVQRMKADAEQRAADERRREEYAAHARATVTAATKVAEEGELTMALEQLASIGFDDPTMASPALDRVKLDVEALFARCEAGQHLQAARAALAAGDPAAAASSLELARQRDSHHPDVGPIAIAIDSARTVRHRVARAQTDLQRGDLESAQRLVSEALGLISDDPEALDVRERVRSAIAEQEAAQERAAADAIASARREAERGEFAMALARLQEHRPAHPAVAAAITDIRDQQLAAERRAADERRRQEHASRARAAMRAARAARDQGDAAAALMLLQGFEFQGPDVDSPALDELRAQADALIADCEASGLLDTAAELNRDNRDAAAEAVEHATIVTGAPDATMFLPRPAAPAEEAAPSPRGEMAAEAGHAFPPTLVPSADSRPDPSVVGQPAPEPPAPPIARNPAAPPSVAATPVPKPTPESGRASGLPSAKPASRTPMIVGGVAAAAIVLAVVWWSMQPGTQQPAVVAENTAATATVTPAAEQPPAPTPSTTQTATPQASETTRSASTASPVTTPSRGPQPPGRGAVTSPAPPGAREGTPGRTGGTQAPTTAGSPQPSSESVQSPPPAATTTPAAVPAPTEGEAPQVTPPAATRTPEASAERPAPPPGPDPARDEAAIRGVIAQLAAGYKSLDVAAIRRVWPSAPASLQQSFDDARSYQVEIDRQQVSVRGDTATVSAVRRIRVQPKAGRAQETAVQSTFTLRRSGGGWIIDSIR